MKDREAVHAYMTPRAHAALTKLAEDNGVSLTSLLEVWGDRVARQVDLWDDLGNYDDVNADFHDLEEAGYTMPTYRELILGCRKVDALRRRRGGS